MKKLFSAALTVLFLCLAQTAQAKVNHLLPKPQVIETKSGNAFALNRNVTITDPTNSTLLAKFFTDNGCTVTGDGATVTVTMVSAIDGAYDYELAGYENEAYLLEITADAINIKAITKTGVIRAVGRRLRRQRRTGDRINHRLARIQATRIYARRGPFIHRDRDSEKAC